MSIQTDVSGGLKDRNPMNLDIHLSDGTITCDDALHTTIS